MKKLLFATLFCLISSFTAQAQTKKIYCYIETENGAVFKNGTFDWKTEVPYKQHVRLISEVIEVPDEYFIREQFYEYVVKNYYKDLVKMKLHKSAAGVMISNYDNPYQPEVGYSYNFLFKKEEKSSWQYEAILIKGFKYNPKNKGPFPLLQKAKQIVVDGKS
jgi:hypothetical protein